MDRSYQLDIRHCYLLAYVVGVQVSRSGYGVVVPVGMVCRRLALADTHRAHDSHTQSAVHTELSLMARNAYDLLDHGYRHLHTIHTIRQFNRSHNSAPVIFPMAHRHPAVVLRAHTMVEEAVHTSV